MKNKSYALNILLAIVLGLTCLIALLVRTFAPAVIIPTLNIPNIVLLSLIALLLNHYLAPAAKTDYCDTALLAVLTFFLLFGAKSGLVGGITFTVVAFLFNSIQDRLSSGPAKKAAPLLSAFGLYLSFQCLTGMIL